MAITKVYSNAELEKFGSDVLFQMGGSNRINGMIGIKQLTLGEIDNNMQLGIKFTCKSANKSNYVVISLESNDLYKMEFKSIRGLKCNDKGMFRGLYDNMLKTIFERETELNLSL